MKTLLLALTLVLASCSSKEEITRIDNKKKVQELEKKVSVTPEENDDSTETQTFEPTDEVSEEQTEQVVQTEIPDSISAVEYSTDVFSINESEADYIYRKCIKGLHDGLGNQSVHARVVEMNTDRIETNSNLVCLVRTHLTPGKVKIKMRANMYEYTDINSTKEMFEYFLSGRDLCDKNGKTTLDDVIKKMGSMGCSVEQVKRNGKAYMRYECADHYGYNQCNSFRKTIKSCKDVKNTDTLTLKFKKMDRVPDDKYEIYRAYTRQGRGFFGSDKRIDFNLKAIQTRFPVKYDAEKSGNFLNIGEDTRTIKYVDDSCEFCD